MPFCYQTEENCIENRLRMRIECFQNILKNIHSRWKEYRFHRSLTLVGDVIISHDSLVTNGEKETSLVSEILTKTRSSKRLCRGAMSQESDHYR